MYVGQYAVECNWYTRGRMCTGSYSLGYFDMQGNAGDYMLKCVCQKGVANAVRWGITLLQLNGSRDVVLSNLRGNSG